MLIFSVFLFLVLFFSPGQFTPNLDRILQRLMTTHYNTIFRSNGDLTGLCLGKDFIRDLWIISWQKFDSTQWFLREVGGVDNTEWPARCHHAYVRMTGVSRPTVRRISPRCSLEHWNIEQNDARKKKKKKRMSWILNQRKLFWSRSERLYASLSPADTTRIQTTAITKPTTRTNANHLNKTVTSFPLFPVSPGLFFLFFLIRLSYPHFWMLTGKVSSIIPQALDYSARFDYYSSSNLSSPEYNITSPESSSSTFSDCEFELDYSPLPFLSQQKYTISNLVNPLFYIPNQVSPPSIILFWDHFCVFFPSPRPPPPVPRFDCIFSGEHYWPSI